MHALDCRVACKGVYDGRAYCGHVWWRGLVPLAVARASYSHLRGIWVVRQARVPVAALIGVLAAGLGDRDSDSTKEKIHGAPSSASYRAGVGSTSSGCQFLHP